MKMIKDNKKDYLKIKKLVHKAGKMAVEFVKHNSSYDSDLQLKCTSSHHLDLR